MWDACASKRGFVCGREAISMECTAGQGEGKRWNLPYGWKKDKREKWNRWEEEAENGVGGWDSAVDSLNAPCWPQGCWQYSFVDSFFLFQVVSLSFAVTLFLLSSCRSISISPCPPAWPCTSGAFPVRCSGVLMYIPNVSVCRVKILCNCSHRVRGEG